MRKNRKSNINHRATNNMNQFNFSISRLLFAVFAITVPISQAQIDPITTRVVSGSVATTPPSGRASFVGNALLYGSALYGPGVISLLKIERSKQKVGLEMLIASSSFLGAMQATKNYQLDYTHTRLMMWGAYLGTAYGLGSLVFFDSADTRKWAIPSMLLTPISAILTRQLTDNRPYSNGETDLLIASGLVGAIYGTGAVYLVPSVENLSESTKGKIYVSSAMLAAPLAVWQTTQLINQFELHQIDRGGSVLFTMGGIIGGLYGAGVSHLLLNRNFPRLHLLSAMASLPIGVYGAYQLEKKNNYTVGRTTLLGLGTVAGAIFSEGLAFFFQFEDSRVYAACGIVGSAIGFYLVHNSTHSDDNKISTGARQVANAPNQMFGDILPMQLAFRF